MLTRSRGIFYRISYEAKLSARNLNLSGQAWILGNQFETCDVAKSWSNALKNSSISSVPNWYRRLAFRACTSSTKSCPHSGQTDNNLVSFFPFPHQFYSTSSRDDSTNENKVRGVAPTGEPSGKWRDWITKRFEDKEAGTDVSSGVRLGQAPTKQEIQLEIERIETKRAEASNNAIGGLDGRTINELDTLLGEDVEYEGYEDGPLNPQKGQRAKIHSGSEDWRKQTRGGDEYDEYDDDDEYEDDEVDNIDDLRATGDFSEDALKAIEFAEVTEEGTDFHYRKGKKYVPGQFYELRDVDLTAPPSETDSRSVQHLKGDNILTLKETLKKSDFRNVRYLSQFLSDSGKIQPRRHTKLGAKAQRKVTRTIKAARNLGLLPFTNLGEPPFRYSSIREDWEYEDAR